MPYPTCIFCELNECPESREDVLPRWVARTFPDGKRTHLEHARGDSRAVNVRRPPKLRNIGEATFGLLTRGACECCNNGWMSTLEKSVQPIMTPILQGESAILLTPHQELIARWAVKTSLMYEYGNFHAFGKHRMRGKTPVFNQTHRSALYTGAELPPGTFVLGTIYMTPSQPLHSPNGALPKQRTRRLYGLRSQRLADTRHRSLGRRG